jgi:hypothetical protein
MKTDSRRRKELVVHGSAEAPETVCNVMAQTHTAVDGTWPPRSVS